MLGHSRGLTHRRDGPAQLIVVSAEDGQVLGLAHPVHHDHETSPPPMSEVGAGRMRQMVIHLLEAVRRKAGQVVLDMGQERVPQKDNSTLSGGDGVKRIRQPVR